MIAAADDNDNHDPRAFRTTRWSIVLNAADENAPKRREALNELCQDYWHPLYGYVLKRGFSSHDAKDLIQGFFERLLEKNFLKSVAPEKGKFRSFLITAVKRYIQNEFEKKNAIKRGGKVSHVSLDFEHADLIYGQLEDENQTPEEVYDRGFALNIIYKVMSVLEANYTKRDKQALFQFLKTTLPGQSGGIPYEAAAEKFNIRLNTVKSEVRRFRQRFRKQMITTVSDLVPDVADVEGEIRYLLEILQRS